MGLVEALRFHENIILEDFDETKKQIYDKNRNFESILDGIFGFGFKGPVSEKYQPVFNFLRETKVPILSIDVPSGWEDSPTKDSINPTANISLGTVKECMKDYQGIHYFANHFMPKKLLEEFSVEYPEPIDRLCSYMILPKL